MKNTNVHNSELELQIAGLLLINKTSQEELKHILPQLEKFIGVKINTQSGFSKKFIIEFLKNEPTERVYLQESYNSLYMNIDIQIKETEFKSGGYGVRYFKKSIWLGKVSNDGKLVSIESFDSINENYNLSQKYDIEAIKAEKQAIKELEERLSELKNDFRQYNFDDSILKYS